METEWLASHGDTSHLAHADPAPACTGGRRPRTATWTVPSSSCSGRADASGAAAAAGAAPAAAGAAPAAAGSSAQQASPAAPGEDFAVSLAANRRASVRKYNGKVLVDLRETYEVSCSLLAAGRLPWPGFGYGIFQLLPCFVPVRLGSRA